MKNDEPASSEGAVVNERRILLVDDDAVYLAYLSKRLGAIGWDVRTQPDGFRALEFLRRTRVTVVVADERMPGTAGAVLLEHARRLQPHARLILLSAWPSVGAQRRVSALGGVAVLKGHTDDLIEALDA